MFAEPFYAQASTTLALVSTVKQVPWLLGTVPLQQTVHLANDSPPLPFQIGTYSLVTEMVPNVLVNDSVEHNHSVSLKNLDSQSLDPIASLVPLIPSQMTNNPMVLRALPGYHCSRVSVEIPG